MKFPLTLAAAILATGAATAQSTDGGFIDIETIEVQEEAPVNDWSGFYAGGSLGTAYVSTENGTSDSETTGGLQFGYNWTHNNLVFGGEVSIDAADADDRTLFFQRVAARLGYAHEKTMVYGSLGGVRVTSGNEEESWGSFGLGVEYMARPDIIVGAAFSRIDIGERYRFDQNGRIVGEQTYVDQARLRVNYKF